jgi:hypothetical protein
MNTTATVLPAIPFRNEIHKFYRTIDSLGNSYMAVCRDFSNWIVADVSVRLPAVYRFLEEELSIALPDSRSKVKGIMDVGGNYDERFAEFSLGKINITAILKFTDANKRKLLAMETIEVMYVHGLVVKRRTTVLRDITTKEREKAFDVDGNHIPYEQQLANYKAKKAAAKLREISTHNSIKFGGRVTITLLLSYLMRYFEYHTADAEQNRIITLVENFLTKLKQKRLDRLKKERDAMDV